MTPSQSIGIERANDAIAAELASSHAYAAELLDTVEKQRQAIARLTDNLHLAQKHGDELFDENYILRRRLQDNHLSADV